MSGVLKSPIIVLRSISPFMSGSICFMYLGPAILAASEKAMATHSNVFAWRIPGMVEPGGLPSMALHRVGHD